MGEPGKRPRVRAAATPAGARRMRTHSLKIVIGVIAFVGVPANASQAQEARRDSGAKSEATQAAPAHDFANWESEIAAFEKADRANPPPKGAILFIGSSTIRLWTTLAEDFPGHTVINRGFGGSEIADATHFADRIIVPYAPRQIFLRAGGNDIHAGRSPEQVAADFEQFVRTVRTRLPDVEIVYISVSPAPARWDERDECHDLNRRIRRIARRLPRVRYIDTFDLGITPDGQPRLEVFSEADKLHFNAEGYKLLAERVRPYLMPAPRPPTESRPPG
jgi:lysophospholipase L1-like esterase